MSKNDVSDEAWQPCPPGTLQNPIHAVVVRRQRQTAARALCAVAVLLFLVGLGGLTWHQWRKPVEYDYGGIVCSEVRRLSEPYMLGKLDEHTSNKIDIHLDHCPNCGPLMRDGNNMSVSKHTHALEKVPDNSVTLLASSKSSR